MSRSISINTVLNRVGSKEPSLADALGSVPTTVQEIATRRISPKVNPAAFCPQSAPYVLLGQPLHGHTCCAGCRMSCLILSVM